MMYTVWLSSLLLFANLVLPANLTVGPKPTLVSIRIDVPAAVKSTVTRLYPGAKPVKWEKGVVIWKNPVTDQEYNNH